MIVEGALPWMDGRESDAEPLLISRYDLQLFLWYQLPRKLLAPLEYKQAVADSLGRFLDRVGTPAYAALCRAEDTRSLLAAWEEGDGDARERFWDLLEASGLEPPNTPLLEWGSVMGFTEARLHYAVAYALEDAVEEGCLVPRQTGFKRGQVAHVEAFLRRPRADIDGRTPLEAIHEERIERWAERGSEKRRGMVRPVASALREPRPDIPSAAIETSLEPLLWLLGLAAEGLQLTQTGALSRALVRSTVERYPHWWHDLGDAPNREDEVAVLRELDELARRMRLLRRKGRKLFLTRRGAALRGDPRGLLRECAGSLLSPRPFAAAVRELAAAVLLAERNLEWDALDARVHAAIVADGWNAAGEPPELRDVRWIVADLVRPAQALGLLRYEGAYPEPRRLVVTEPGRLALQTALRARATEPAETVI